MTPAETTELFLAVAWESYLAGERLVIPTERTRRLSCWDFWYVSYCVRRPPADLFAASFPDRLRELRDGAESADDVWQLVEAAPVGWPEHGAAYAGLQTWRQAQRLQKGRGLTLPVGAHCLVLVKPDVMVEPVLAALEPTLQVERRQTRLLRPEDVRRLYPTAYGSEFVGRVVNYLTSGPCTLLLAAARQPISNLDEYKARLRRRLGVIDDLRNAVHVPASLGELYSNLAQLLGQAAVWEAYDEHSGTKHERRAAFYRVVLGAGPGARDVPE